MELREFVKQTLVEISQGVILAQKELKDTNAIINPSLIADDIYVDENRGRRLVHSVKFNVGITTEEKEGVKSGIGVLTGLFSLGATGNSEGVNKSISSIEFSVPVSLPNNDELKKEVAKMKSRLV